MWVGRPTTLLTDGGLSTIISKPNGSQGDFMSSLGRWQNRGSNRDRYLIIAFRSIGTMADRSAVSLSCVLCSRLLIIGWQSSEWI